MGFSNRKLKFQVFNIKHFIYRLLLLFFKAMANSNNLPILYDHYGKIKNFLYSVITLFFYSKYKNKIFSLQIIRILYMYIYK